MDQSDAPLTLNALLRFTASIAAEFYIARAGEPISTGGTNQRGYDVEDAVNEAATLLTFALSPELAGRSFETAAAVYGVGSLLDRSTLPSAKVQPVATVAARHTQSHNDAAAPDVLSRHGFRPGSTMPDDEF